MIRLSYLLVLVFLMTTSLSAQEEISETEIPSDSDQQVAKRGGHEFSVGSRGDMVVNDGPGLFNYLKPFFQYQRVGQEAPYWNFEVMTAYKQNRIVLKNQYQKNWAWYLRGDVEISNDGDSPSVDGKDFEEFEFKAHTYRGMFGLEWKDLEGDFPVQLQLMASSRYYQIYNKSDSPLFIDPANFWENTLHLRMDTGSPVPGTELADFGFRTITNAAFFNRLQNKVWGPVTNAKQVKNFGKLSMGARMAYRFWGPLVLVSGVQGSSVVGKVDRLNAIRSAQFAQRDEALFVSAVRAERVVSGDLGLRIYFEKKGYFAIRPFAYAVAYRELLPNNLHRKDAAMGGGMKLMGRVGRSVFTDLTYAVGKGNRPDLPTIHQVKYSLVARF